MARPVKRTAPFVLYPQSLLNEKEGGEGLFDLVGEVLVAVVLTGGEESVGGGHEYVPCRRSRTALLLRLYVHPRMHSHSVRRDPLPRHEILIRDRGQGRFVQAQDRQLPENQEGRACLLP